MEEATVLKYQLVVLYVEALRTISSLFIYFFFLGKDFARTKTRYKRKSANKIKRS